MLIRKEAKEFMKNIKNLKIYKKCLIIVDMVNGFTKEGILHDEKILKVVPRQLELIQEYQNTGELIVFIKDSHSKDSTEFKRFGNTTHCLENERESELIDELKPFEYNSDTVSITKNSTSFMESPEFRELITKLKNVNQVDIIGCCTDICVANGAIGLANYFDQWNRNIEINVHTDAVETYDSKSHDRSVYSEAAKLLMQQQGIKLVKKK